MIFFEKNYFSLSQDDVDDYYEFIQDWYAGAVKGSNPYIDQAVGQEISQYKYESGLLVPLLYRMLMRYDCISGLVFIHFDWMTLFFCNLS